MGRAVVSPGDLAALVEGLRGLPAGHDRRVPVRPHRDLTPFERLVLQIARPVLRKPVLFRQDEPPRTDASKVRSQDFAQDDDVAKQFRPAQVFSELRQIVFHQRCCLCHRFRLLVVVGEGTDVHATCGRETSDVGLFKRGHPVLDRDNSNDLPRGGTAGHVEYDSGDPARVVRGEEECRACNVIGHSESSDRVCIDQHLSLRFGDALLVAIREDRLGGDAIHTDSKGTGLGRQVLREYLDAGLRRGIRDRRPGMGAAAGRGGDRDDVARLPLLHTGQDTLDREERRGEIAFDGCTPPFLGRVLERTGRGIATARIGDQDLDRPKLSLDLAAHGLDLVELGRVGEDLNRPSPGAFDRLPHDGQGRDVPAVDRDLRTVLGEHAGDRRTDATGTPGHQRDLVVQSAHADGLAPEGVRLATTRPQISTETIETWYARSGTVRGPTPMAIVNSPTRVPSNANVWAARPIPRVNAGPTQVVAQPTSRTAAITLSAVPAARCSYPLTRIPKWDSAATTNVAASKSRNNRIPRAALGETVASSFATVSPKFTVVTSAIAARRAGRFISHADVRLQMKDSL